MRRGLAAYVQVLASLRARDLGASGDTVRIDAAETATAMCFPYVLQNFYNGTDCRRGDQDIPAGQVLCRGSWVCVWVYSNRFERLCRALGLEDCLTDPRFAEVRERVRNWPAFFERVQEHVADRDPDAFVAELQSLDIISARAFRPSEIRAERPSRGAGLLAPRPHRRRRARDPRPAVPPQPHPGARTGGGSPCCRLTACASSS